MSVSDENVVSGNFNNFEYGNSSSGRLEAHYYLAVDIDATPTRLWKGKGFTPISSKDTAAISTGSIDGRGNAVRGLFINRGGNAGLIETLDARGTIKHLGVEEAEMRSNGSGSAGILAAFGNGTIERVWTTGKIVGNILPEAPEVWRGVPLPDGRVTVGQPPMLKTLIFRPCRRFVRIQVRRRR